MQVSALPGALTFRWLAMVILTAIFFLVFLSYSYKISMATEKASVQQTKNIINSTLAVMFARFAVAGELDRLNELNGVNPFEYLEKYGLMPTTYQGEIEGQSINNLVPGWYYNSANGLVFYKSYHEKSIDSFKVMFDFRDVNQSGLYESGIDVYQRLMFERLPPQ